MGDENIISTSRASRSRSRTPFLRSSCDRELCNSASESVHSHKLQLQYEHSLTAVAECTDEGKTFSFKYSDTAFGTASVTGEPRALRKKKGESRKKIISPAKTFQQINGLYRNSKELDVNSAVNNIESKRLTDVKTGDYSTKRENTSQDPNSAFHLYKQSGDWWNVFPKTDYTYSEYSPHRKEIAPGIVNMPNMSRLGLHNQDLMSPTQNVAKQNIMQKFSTSYERSRYSSSYSKQGGDQYDSKWARVLGSEYSSNEISGQDHSPANDTHIMAKILTVIISYMFSLTSWMSRCTSFLYSDNIYSGNKSENYLPMTLRERILQWIYHVLGYIKFVDTWLLLGWNKGIFSSNSISNTHSQRLCTRLMKALILFLPTMLIAGCWAYAHIWDDQGVSNSISIPEPNEPLLTSHPKSVSGSVIQDFGTFSPLKLLATSFASNLHILWMWIPFLMTKNEENEDKLVVENAIKPLVPIIQSSDKFKHNIIECTNSPPQVNMDELISSIIMNPLFVNILSSTKGSEESGLKIDNILLKMDHMQQQLNQKTSEIELLKNRIKSEVELHVNAFSKNSREDNDAVLDKLNKLALRIDEISSQHQYLENIIHIESSTRETSLLELREIMTKLKEQYSVQPTVQVSNEFHSHENFNKFKLEILKYVDEQFTKYDADKTGLPDYALESSGGSIVSTRCTETYQAKTAVFSLFGIPLWSPSINPRKIIQPGILPGECWAFKGSQGYVVIKLSKKVHITRFSLEHTPKSLSPVGTIDSAPRNFSVWGLKSETDTNGQLFGQYVYNQNGSSLQYFPVEEPDLPPYQFIELRVESNQGNLEYTCVYRFRVHGIMHREENELYGQHGN